MFKHKNHSAPKEEKPIEETGVESEVKIKENRQVDLGSIKELMEKNLKWSQIIYEQNRKINHKLMWAAIFSWFRLLVILVPLALAIWFLPSLMKDVWKQYGDLLGISSSSTTTQKSSLESLLKMFNLSPAQQGQIKGIVK